mmetsp:Transcript_26936/g.67853  ORF Transcript_26936/g.67853 Transcript_26936/m.67853 type:complete len:171 (+) Transcript_26936:401-913(+)|eukprot:CAMPEP_0178990308 /NCGR_PEP_ID=MMETSP0795-20121207/4861_1 /TAXON_ID=88552 /ORGANISM="Amoebophrya sp., Strain Ameob2" /LENGTH=170 /DNA_ID=CAMNT_0020681813 /DNA_START=159 /DNA_END=671 /DNA_ORIENTATION=+
MAGSSCSSSSTGEGSEAYSEISKCNKVAGLSDDLVDFLRARGTLNEGVARPKVTRQQQMHTGSHCKQLMLEKKRPAAVVRSVKNPVGDSRRDPQNFDANETKRTEAFQEAFKAMERVKSHANAETSVQGNPSDGCKEAPQFMQQKRREQLEPRIAAAGHVPPLWWGDSVS